MDSNSVKRLLVTAITAAVLLVGHKLGVATSILGMVTGLVSAYIMQSGANSAIGKFVASKGVQTVASVVEDVEQAVTAAEGAGASAAAASAPASPSASQG